MRWKSTWLRQFLVSLTLLLLLTSLSTASSVRVEHSDPESVHLATEKVKSVEQVQEEIANILQLQLQDGQMTCWFALRDEEGDPILDLTSRDIEVIERIDGIPHQVKIRKLSLQHQPLASLLLLDVSSSMSSSDLSQAKRALGSYISQMRPGDLAGLVFFNSSPMMVKSFTDSRLLLKAALQLPFHGGGTALFDAIYTGLNAFGELNSRHLPVLVAFTDGEDGNSTHSMDEVLQLATAHAVPIFTVGVGGADANVLEKLARTSNGIYFRAENTASLESVYDSISNLLRTSYLLSFSSQAKKGQRVSVVITASVDENGEQGTSHKRTVRLHGEFTAQ